VPDSPFQHDPPPDWTHVRAEVAGRVRQVRLELYGENGGPLLAGALRLPYRRWIDYERGGASIPGDVLLRFVEHTRADPHWLLTGQGPKYFVDL